MERGSMQSLIHSTAFAGPDGEVAEYVKIGAFTCLYGMVSVGSGTSIGKHCVFGGGSLARNKGLAFGTAKKFLAELQ
jgi:acyl-[acyl carrier protein]--UDP-N-acetylglucosamine O-acyltransferase